MSMYYRRRRWGSTSGWCDRVSGSTSACHRGWRSGPGSMCLRCRRATSMSWRSRTRVRSPTSRRCRRTASTTARGRWDPLVGEPLVGPGVAAPLPDPFVGGCAAARARRRRRLRAAQAACRVERTGHRCRFRSRDGWHAAQRRRLRSCRGWSSRGPAARTGDRPGRRGRAADIGGSDRDRGGREELGDDAARAQPAHSGDGQPRRGRCDGSTGGHSATGRSRGNTGETPGRNACRLRLRLRLRWWPRFRRLPRPQTRPYRSRSPRHR